MADRLKGVFAPVLTPFTGDLAPDVPAWLAQCRWLAAQECGLAIFGTNSEASSLALAEKRAMLDAAVEAGIAPSRMMPGTGQCALPETVELTRAAVEAGAGGVLMLPPFYFKGVSEEGLFAFYSEVIERVGDPRLRVYLYHIPQFSQVPITSALIERLRAAYPGTMAGIKDSSGDWANTRALIERFEGFDVFSGSESILRNAMQLGGAGCISAIANINPAAIRDLCIGWSDEDAAALQARVTAVRAAVSGFAMIPALKATVARFTGDPGWARTRPPLDALPEAEAARLARALAVLDFDMPDRREAA